MGRDFAYLFEEEDLTEARELLWHGTSTKFTKKIISQGFIPEPQEKTWDAGRLESYPGTYLTHDFFTAYSAASDTKRKFGGNRVIFQAQIEMRTTLPDEDNIPRADGALSQGGNISSLNSYLAKNYLSSKTAYDKWMDKAEVAYRKALNMFTTGMDNRQWSAIKPLVREYLDHVAKAAAASQKNEWDSVDYDENRYHTQAIRSLRGNIISKLRGMNIRVKPSDKYHMHVRVDRPIAFRGANKLLQATEIITPEGQDYGSEGKPVILKAIFGGKVPADLLAQYRLRVGSSFIVK